MKMKLNKMKLSVMISILGLFGISCSSFRCEYGGVEDVEWEERDTNDYDDSDSNDENKSDDDSQRNHTGDNKRR
mgnify:CR=1 FL=1